MYQPGLLLQGHSGKQVRDALVYRKSPILIWVKHSIAVQVLEREVPGLEQGRGTSVDFRLLCRGARRLRRRDLKGKNSTRVTVTDVNDLEWDIFLLAPTRYHFVVLACMPWWPGGIESRFLLACEDLRR